MFPEETYADMRRTCNLYKERPGQAGESNPGPSCYETQLLIFVPIIDLNKFILRVEKTNGTVKCTRFINAFSET